MRFHDDESVRARIKTTENAGKRGRIWMVFVEIIPYEIRLTFLTLLPLQVMRNVCVTRRCAHQWNSSLLR